MNKAKKKIEKFGKLPINARITIDYSKPKPKISFGYIGKKEQKKFIYNNPISMLLAMATILILLFVLQGGGPEDNGPHVGECNVYEQFIQGGTHIYGYNITCSNTVSNSTGPRFQYFILDYRDQQGKWFFGTPAGFYQVDSSENNLFTTGFTTWTNKYKDYAWYVRVLWIIPLFFIVGVIFVIMLFAMLGLINFYGWVLQIIPGVNTWTNKKIPELNKMMTSVNYSATFRKCPESKIIELPLFSNVFLDYRATKQFSKYLDKVEIREHPFDSLIRNKRRDRLKKKRRKKYKKGKNFFLWRARFIFKEVPKTGFLEIRWK
jgi:hypothetical protein